MASNNPPDSSSSKSKLDLLFDRIDLVLEEIGNVKQEIENVWNKLEQMEFEMNLRDNYSSQDASPSSFFRFQGRSIASPDSDGIPISRLFGEDESSESYYDDDNESYGSQPQNSAHSINWEDYDDSVIENFIHIPSKPE